MKKSDDELKAIAQQALDTGIEPGGVYRHYEGGLCVIVAVSLDEATLTPLITYRSSARGTFWTRTLANFTEMVDWGQPSTLMPRFQRVWE